MKSGIVFTVACGAGICAAVADDEQPARMTPKVVSAISCFFI
jgi:diaminopimelate epimerase